MTQLTPEQFRALVEANGAFAASLRRALDALALLVRIDPGIRKQLRRYTRHQRQIDAQLRIRNRRRDRRR